MIIYPQLKTGTLGSILASMKVPFSFGDWAKLSYWTYHLERLSDDPEEKAVFRQIAMYVQNTAVQNRTELCCGELKAKALAVEEWGFRVEVSLISVSRLSKSRQSKGKLLRLGQ
jgi:hypothetical protein